MAAVGRSTVLFFFYSATAMMAGNPAVIQSMVKEHEDHVKKVFKHIDDMAKKHDVRTSARKPKMKGNTQSLAV